MFGSHFEPLSVSDQYAADLVLSDNKKYFTVNVDGVLTISLSLKLAFLADDKMRENIANAYLIPARERKAHVHQMFIPMSLDKRKTEQRFMVDMKVEKGDIICIYLFFEYNEKALPSIAQIASGVVSFQKRFILYEEQ